MRNTKPKVRTFLDYKTVSTVTGIHDDGFLKEFYLNAGDHEVTTEIDSITVSEIKGWIRTEHINFASRLFARNQPVSYKTTHPRKSVTQYLSQSERGTVTTTIVERTKEEPPAQLTLMDL